MTGVYCLAYALAGALVGSAAGVILPELGNPDNAFAKIATAVLPVGIRGLVLAAALAAMMSTASACLMAASTVFANGLYARFFTSGAHAGIFVNRIFMLLVGVISFALASMILGSGVALVLIFTQGILANSPIIFGLLASLVAFVVVSLVTGRPSPEKLDAWEQRMQEPAGTEVRENVPSGTL